MAARRHRSRALIAGSAAAALLAGTAGFSGPLATEPPRLASASVAPVPFDTLSGWADDDHLAALRHYAEVCGRPAAPVSREARDACAAARSTLGEADGPAARRFFESRFAAWEVRPDAGHGFLTGYFEPVLDGSLVPAPGFGAALLARPRGAAGPGGWPTRREIDAGALAGRAEPVVHLRDPVDAFIVHVQGSARVRLTDGRTVRVAFDGRNGHPYTAVGRVLAETLGVPPAAMTADAVWAWLRAHPAEAPAMLARNASYIFFRLDREPDPARGPEGAAGIPLVPGRSLAIDPSIWPYGTPVWLDGRLPGPDGRDEALARLVIAADTGSAIRGPARGDLFVGSGEAAGLAAGRLRQSVRFIALWPREAAEP